jgi:hypothetical protein
MKYWVIERSNCETYVAFFNDKKAALSYLHDCLKDTYDSLSDYTLIEGKELKITRSVSVDISAEE